MQTQSRLSAAILAISFASVLLTGCGTVYGAGKDVSAAGTAISKTAKENKTY